MYARTYNEAVNYLKSNYPESYITDRTGQCTCGESLAVIAEDEDGNELEEVIICDACWQNADNAERVPSPSTISDEDLADILTDVYAAEEVYIIQRWKSGDDTDLIQVQMNMEDEDVCDAFIYFYAHDNSLFITYDDAVLDGNPVAPVHWEKVGDCGEHEVVLNAENEPCLAGEEEAPRQSISNTIRNARNAKGLSIRALAEKTGLTKNAIHLMESGKHNFTIASLEKVCRVLGLTITIG